MNLRRPLAQPKCSPGQNCKSQMQLVRVPLKSSCHKRRFDFRLKTGEPNEHHSRMKQAPAEYKFSEILVRRQQNGV